MAENIPNSNLSNPRISEEFRSLFTISFQFYTMAEKTSDLYNDPRNVNLVKKLIELYYRKVSPTYNKILERLKQKYIELESTVEKNDSIEEQIGIGYVYDYIKNLNVKKDPFNVFTNSIKIHQELYRECDKKLKDDYEQRYREVVELKERAIKEKSKELYSEYQEKYRNLPESNTFGGKLRVKDVTAGAGIEVPPCHEAMLFFNSFLNPEKVVEMQKVYKTYELFDYIDYCVNLSADLILYQPFQDGNKRTFRSLVNLMFKMRNIPPIFIKENEREAYLNALNKAVMYKDYKDLDQFYYFKICDSIYEFDVALMEEKQEKTPVESNLKRLYNS